MYECYLYFYYSSLSHEQGCKYCLTSSVYVTLALGLSLGGVTSKQLQKFFYFIFYFDLFVLVTELYAEDSKRLLITFNQVYI